MINKCWEIREGNKKEERKTFLPMNLKWSHYGTIDMSRILPRHFRHCDIGSFRFTGDNKVILVFDTATQPNQVEGDKYPNVLESGRYQIELIIGANNVETFTQVYEISFNDDFYKTEKDMFLKNISITKIK